MKRRAIYTYETNDGMTHDDKNSAIRHEVAVEFERMQIPEDVQKVLLKNSKQVAKLLAAFRRTEPKEPKAPKAPKEKKQKKEVVTA